MQRKASTLQVPYPEYIWSNLDDHSHLPALVCGLTDKTLTHGQLQEESLKLSRAFRFFIQLG